MVNADTVTANHRGRVVMLADNGIDGDSRVQKSARSAAQAGWDVILLGLSADETTRSWRLGRAEVRLVPVPTPLAKKRHEFRRPWLLAPFAYPPNGIAQHRQQAVRAWRADLRTRRATMPPGGGRLRPVRRGMLSAQQFAARLLGYWVAFRSWQLASARKVRRRLNTPWDRAYTHFWRLLQKDGCWRRLEPGLWDYELAFGPIIDELAPDIIHAHDFRMLGVGARARIRAAERGRRVPLVWDAPTTCPVSTRGGTTPDGCPHTAPTNGSSRRTPTPR